MHAKHGHIMMMLMMTTVIHIPDQFTESSHLMVSEASITKHLLK